jgi:photosystem II stability/assembly factor-like uncharacterized protein
MGTATGNGGSIPVVPIVDPKYLTHLRYRCIGPTRGGRVVAVAADPEQRAVFYFGAVAGGVWKSDDGGQFWENVTDGFLTTSSIGALAVAPSDGNVVYAGTGESTIRIDVTHGDGVYKSTDAGRTWHHVGLAQSRHIGQIRVHPHDPDTVFVAALGHASKDNPERGLYRTRDGGATWDLVLHVSERAGAVDVSLDPNNPRHVYATIWQARRTFWSIDSGGPDSGLWRSNDGGDTWQDISHRPGMPDGILGKIGVSASPARTGRVFAMVESTGRTRGLYRSDDHGDTWEHVCAKPDLGWRPWYYQHVVAHPTDPDTVFVLNMRAWRSIDGGKTFEEFHTPHGDNHALWIDPNDPDRMIGADDGGAWVSFNAGESWSSIYNQLTAQFYHVATDDQYPYMVYGSQQDNSSIAEPSRTGLGAINWADCYPPGTAESGYVAPKPGDPDIVYVGAIGSSPGGGDALQRYDHRTKQVQLVSVWPEAYHDGATAEVRFQWTYPIVFAPHDPNVLYAAGNKVFRTTDEGHSWEAISPDLTYADPDTLGVSGPLTMDTAGAEMYATVFSLMVSAHAPGTLMAGSDDGRVHLTTDDGGEWTEITPPDLPKFSQVTMIAESPHTPGTVYMTVARHKMGDDAPYVYRTTDLGTSWDRIDAGLPEHEFCRVIREDPNRQGLLYVGTELGIHVSFDDGASWQSLQANLPVTPVYDFVIKDTDLVVATHGRSFWILDDLTPLHQLRDDVLDADRFLLAPRPTVRNPPHIAAVWGGTPGGKNYHVTAGQNATFYVEEHDTGHVTTRVLDAGEDLERGVRFAYYLDDDATGDAELTILDHDGNEVDNFPSTIPTDKKDRHGLYITAHAGMNTFQWPMTYRAGVKMVDTEFHARPSGPLAKPGTYRARLTVGDWATTTEFELIRDPRITTSDTDLADQFDLLIRIRDALSEIATAVNTIRSLRSQLSAWHDRLQGDDGAKDVVAAATAVSERLTEIEHQLVQVELTSDGDTLNYREQLFERLGHLVPVVSSADARPTEQSYAVYDKLAGEAREQLAALADVIAVDLADVNSRLAALGVDIVGVAG